MGEAPPPGATVKVRRGIPLRVSLIGLMLVLVAVGLVVSGVSVTSAMENRLIERTDNGLKAVAEGWARPRGDGQGGPPQFGSDGGSPQSERRPPSPYWIKQTRSDGTTFVIDDGITTQWTVRRSALSSPSTAD